MISETDETGTAIRDYVYLNGQPAAVKVYGSSAGWYYFLNDHIGTPQKMADVSGNVVWEAAYLPFGEAVILKEDIENNLRFPGQYFDGETGLHYNWHRYYDPGTGRYVTADPIGLAGGINPFVYCLNDPVNMVDPNGLETILLTPNGIIVIPTPMNSPTVQLTPRQWEQMKDDLKSLFGPIPDYKGNKEKYKKSKRSQELKFGGPCKEVEPPGNDQCEEMEKMMWRPEFEKMPLSGRILFRIMYYFTCNDIG